MRSDHRHIRDLLRRSLLVVLTVGCIFQTPAPGQVSVALLDEHLAFPEGEFRGRLTHALRASEPDGPFTEEARSPTDVRAAVWDIVLYVRGTNRLYEFHNRANGLVARYLVLTEGRQLWYADVLRNRLRRVEGVAETESLLGTAFSFYDLAGFGLEGDSNGARAEPYVVGQRNYAKLNMEMLRPAGYARIVALTDPAVNQRPLRLDYYNTDRILYKTLAFAYNREIAVTPESAGTLAVPVRLEMVDLTAAAVSRLAWYEYHADLIPEAAVFDPRYLMP
ncbi:MAG: outer membrane lipoprotein-sorting protein [Leptospiraceae bacterium]|nr:outer membrane lipoprotein-sorting protein [Leptospiraceae bacterium]